MMYYLGIFIVFQIFYFQGLRPNCKLVRKWNDDYMRKQVYIYKLIYFDYRFIYGSVQTINRTITGGTFATRLFESKKNQEKV